MFWRKTRAICCFRWSFYQTDSHSVIIMKRPGTEGSDTVTRTGTKKSFYNFLKLKKKYIFFLNLFTPCGPYMSRVPIHIGSDFPLVGREFHSLSSFYDLVALLDSSVDAAWLSLSMLISIHKLRN